MTLLRTPVVAALVTCAALAIGSPTAAAQTWPTLPVGVGPAGFDAPAGGCLTSTIGQGRASGNTVQACVAGGLSFIGPTSNVSSVVGPTIITPAFVGTSIVSGGNVAIGP
jgi:hypothetical protein